MKRTAKLMRGELGKLTFFRFLFGAVGGIALPMLFSVFVDPHAPRIEIGGAALLIATVGTLCLVLGELAERSLFFMAAASPKMPGAIGK